MKILYITTIGVTMGFFESFIKEQLDIGNQIDIATNENNGKAPVPSCYREWGCKIYHLDTSRSPINYGNIRAVKLIREIVKDNNYDIVHCHTPIAAAVTRIACKDLRQKGLKVIYTAHGFHFYDGAPIKNWLIYYPIEKWLSKYTDVLVTINKEDYNRAKENFHADRIEYIPGVGINLDKFKPNYDKLKVQEKRKELGIPLDAKLLISVGELNANKNHKVVVEALQQLSNNYWYIIAGKGALKDELIASDYTGRLKLLGQRTDILDLLHCSDLFVFPSLREGLPAALMEAMAAGVNVVASNIRGNVDLLDENLVSSTGKNNWKYGIEKAINNDISKDNLKRIQSFCINKVNKQMHELYENTQ